MKLTNAVIFYLLVGNSLFAQSGSWLPIHPKPGDTLTIICSPTLDSQIGSATVSDVVLYWGVNGTPGNWQLPPQKYWPEGSVTAGAQSVETPMVKVGSSWQVKIPTDEDFSKLLFLFRVNNKSIWLRDSGKDYEVRVSAESGTYSHWEIKDEKVLIYSTKGFISVTSVKDNIIRISYDDSTNIVTNMLVSEGPFFSPTEISESDSHLTISFPTISTKLNKASLSFEFYNSTQQLLLKESSNGLVKEGNHRGVIFNGDIFPKYGFGEKGTSINRNGQKFDTYNRANYGYGQALSTMKINIPFLASLGNYGLFFDNEFPADVDLDNKISYIAWGGKLTYFVISGNLEQQIADYHFLTGAASLPPKWAFGFMQSKYGYQNEAEVRTLAGNFRNKKIPIDVIILDLYWFGNEATMGNMQWDLTRFPDPKKLIEDMNQLGIKLIPIQELYITQQSRLFSIISAQNLFAKTETNSDYIIGGFWAGSAGLFDLTHPNAKSFWWNESKKIMEDGIDGWWTDLGEPENHPGNMIHVSGSAQKVHNTYNLLWSKYLHEGFQEDFPNRRFFNLTRSGTAGMQRYASFPWSGDVERSWNGLGLQPNIMLGMSLSGISYMHSDLGGFAGPATTSELYIRWLQFGAFAGIMRSHTSHENYEPWAFGVTTENYAKNSINLRYQLFPYIYSAAHEYSQTGKPFVRPLIYDFPENSNYINYTKAFMLGNSILVVPVVTQGATSVQVNIPPGNWYLYSNPAVTYSQGNATLSAPLSSIPFLIKEGTILPKMATKNSLSLTTLDSIYLTVYPHKQQLYANGNMIDDDGRSLEYKMGKFISTEFNLSQIVNDSTILNYEIISSGISYDQAPENRAWITRFPSTQTLVTATLNGNPLPMVSSQLEFNQTEGNLIWQHSTTMQLEVKITTELIHESYLQLILKPTSTSIESQTPFQFGITHNYPNPFNPKTIIHFQLSQSNEMQLKVFDVLGRQISLMISEYKSAGSYSVEFDGSHLPSGVYFVQLVSGHQSDIKKMMLVK